MAGPDLSHARLCLLFTPALVPEGRDPLSVLSGALPFVDLVQVRVKESEAPTSPARELLDVTREVLELVDGRVPVLVNDRVDVGCAYDRVQAAGLPLALSLGMHPNDLMFSFYVVTPSGFAIEFGADGRVIDDDTWQVNGAVLVWMVE